MWGITSQPWCGEKRDVLLLNMHCPATEINYCDKHRHTLKTAVALNYGQKLLHNSNSMSRQTWKWTKSCSVTCLIFQLWIAGSYWTFAILRYFTHISNLPCSLISWEDQSPQPANWCLELHHSEHWLEWGKKWQCQKFVLYRTWNVEQNLCILTALWAMY